jgi:hypothetical protein
LLIERGELYGTGSFAHRFTIFDNLGGRRTKTANPSPATVKSPDIVCHQSISSAIDRGLENHFLARVPNLRPPEKTYFYWFDQSRDFGQELVNHLQCYAVRDALLRTLQHILIFQKERGSSQRDTPPICHEPEYSVS